MTRQRHFARYISVPDPNRPHTAAVLDRSTDRVIVDGLTPDDATELARDWNRHEPPEVSK